MKHRRGREHLPSLTLNQQAVSRRMKRIGKRELRAKVRWAQICGIIIGLSASSLLLAHSAQGTHAIFVSRSTNAGNTFSAAKDFPDYDDQIAKNAKLASQTACSDNEQLLQAIQAMKGAATASEAKDLLGNVVSLVHQVQADLGQANLYQKQLDVIANRDLQDYQNAKQAAQGSQELAEQLDSDKRVVAWSSAADNAAVETVHQAERICGDPDDQVNTAKEIIAEKQAAGAAATAATNAPKNSTPTNPVNTGGDSTQ